MYVLITQQHHSLPRE